MSNYKKISLLFSKEIKKRFKKDIVKIILFGSVADNNEDFNSDIDILVITRIKNLELKDALHNTAAEYLLKYNVPIGLKVVDLNTYYKLSDIPTDFYKEIKRNGIMI